MREVLILDPAKCYGCRTCEVVCSLANEGEAGIFKSRVKTVRFPDEYFFYPNVCLQCETAYCALVCPTSALKKNQEIGVVDLDRERCIGCKMCLVACPFGAISISDGNIIKCDLCSGDPACAKFCPPGAIRYGYVEDIGEAKRVIVAEKMKELRSAAP